MPGRRCLGDDAWCLQEKFDGKRIMVAVKGGQAEGYNRKGLCVSLPQEVMDSLAHLPDCELDGELLGEEYVVFDLLKLDWNDLRRSSYRVRYEVLVDLLGGSFGPCVRVAESAWNTAEKRTFYERIAAAGGEVVVFKKVNAPSVAGRPAWGGSQVKCNFMPPAPDQTAFLGDRDDLDADDCVLRQLKYKPEGCTETIEC